MALHSTSVLSPRAAAPSVRELAVIEDAGDSCRVAVLRLHASGLVIVDAVGDAQGPAEQAAPRLIGALARRGRREVLVTTADAVPVVDLDDGAVDDPRPRLTARFTGAAHGLWARTAAMAGMTLAGVYPLLGSALAGVRVESEKTPGLLLQVERTGTALIEHVGARCRDVEVVSHDAPSIARCLRLVGEGCPTVLLSGGGADLSELGFGLVSAGTTWVRLAPLLGRVECDADPASLAAIVGAARHASGLAPRDATAPVARPSR